MKTLNQNQNKLVYITDPSVRGIATLPEDNPNFQIIDLHENREHITKRFGKKILVFNLSIESDYKSFFNFDSFLIEARKVIDSSKSYQIIPEAGLWEGEDKDLAAYKTITKHMTIPSDQHIKNWVEWLKVTHEKIVEELFIMEDHYNHSINDMHSIRIIFWECQLDSSKEFKIWQPSGLENSVFEAGNQHLDTSLISTKKSMASIPDRTFFRKNNTELEAVKVDGTWTVTHEGTSYKLIESSKSVSILSNGISSTLSFYIYSRTRGDDRIVVFKSTGKLSMHTKVFGLSGSELSSFTDTYGQGYLTRVYGEFELQIDLKTGLIMNLKKSDRLMPLTPRSDNIFHHRLSTKFVSTDKRWGTIDIETYKDINNKPKVYAIGYYVEIGIKHYDYFYLGEEKTYNAKLDVMNRFQTDNYDNDKLVVDFFTHLTKTASYNNFIFYVHNLGGYDLYFFLRPLLESNKFTFSPNMRDGKVLSIKITCKETKKNITLVDSLNILNSSLKDLCSVFKTDTVKGDFPYKFMSSSTLQYVGPKPGKEFWELKNEDDLKWYDEIPSEDWNAKLETSKYMKSDVVSLYEVMNKFMREVWEKYGVYVTESITISSLAMQIFYKKYHSGDLGYIDKDAVFNCIKQAYYGGVTEVYKPHNYEGETLYYYDVNSLYPYAALNSMPGKECTVEYAINKDIKDLPNLFGFFYARVECTDDRYLGVLPTRVNGTSILPTGKWSGWYFSEELKYASECGYNIFIVKGYHFNKVDNVFNNYVNSIYEEKSKATGSLRLITKSLLNNLLGRFGLDINRAVSIITDRDKLMEMMKIVKHHSCIPIIDNKIYIVQHDTKISKSVCLANGIDFVEAATSGLINTSNKSRSFTGISIGISAAVTSYARIHMHKVKLEILDRGGKIYYTDTDSIVTNIPFNTDSPILKEGNNLGEFKLEHTISKGWFFSFFRKMKKSIPH